MASALAVREFPQERRGSAQESLSFVEGLVEARGAPMDAGQINGGSRSFATPLHRFR